MAYCSNCGIQVDEHAKFCAVCGTPLKFSPDVQEEKSKEYTQEVTTVVPVSGEQPLVPARKWKAIVSFVLGLVSVLSPCLCCIAPLAMGIVGLLAGITALVFAILSRKDTGRHFCGLAIAGLILSIFGIFISLVVTTFAILYLIALPFLPDFDNYWETYRWIYENFGEEAAKWYESIMSATGGV